MDIQRAVSDFMNQGDELLSRLRSTEGSILSEMELQNLRVCLEQIGIEATNRQHIKLLDKVMDPKHTPSRGIVGG